jgi:hypothetical protein
MKKSAGAEDSETRRRLSMAGVTLLLTLCLTAPLPAQELGQYLGHWEGSISLPTGELVIKVDITQQGDSLAGTIDIPLQGATGLPLEDFSLDTQVDAEQNLPEIEKALSKGGNKDITIKLLPNLNHLFQHATTGTLAEYAEIEETFDPETLQLISEWILERFGSSEVASSPQ